MQPSVRENNIQCWVKAREHQLPLYMCFVDFKKAFDSISHDKLWVTMMDMGYPLHLIDLLAKPYRKQLAKVKVAGTLSEWFHVKKGVRQGCVLSPYLCNILAEMVMRETLDGFRGGLQIGGQMITNRLYADDIILLATFEAELQEFVDRLDRVSRKYTWRDRTVSPRTPGRRIAHDVADGWARNGRDGRVFHVARQGEAFHSLSRHFATTSSFANPLPVSRRHLYGILRHSWLSRALF